MIAREQIGQQVQGELEHVGPPLAALALQVAAQRVGERGQVEEVVLRTSRENRGLAVDPPECGLIRSAGDQLQHQLSHWSPRAPSYPQIG